MVNEQLAFGWEEEPTRELLPRAAALADRLHGLARRGVHLGTSSWKYRGWLGQVYSPARYQVRGRFAEQKFNRQCLAEYAKIFPTVCGDFVFYQFPSAGAWEQVFGQVPEGFRFSLKVPEDVTVERFPDLPRYGRRAGRENPDFMNSSLVCEKLLARLEPYRSKLGVLIFEFGTIHRRPMNEPGEFAAALDRLLSGLPGDRFKFAVEVRNREFLGPKSDYLECLRTHQVAHCFNSWTRMPSVAEQMQVPGLLAARHAVARFLLRPGRSYQQAVEQFSPYERVRDPYPQGRQALAELIRSFLPDDDERTLFAFVNNRFEGNAVETIERTIESLE